MKSLDWVKSKLQNKYIFILTIFILSRIFIWLVGAVYNVFDGSDQSIWDLLFRWDSPWYKGIIVDGYMDYPQGMTGNNAANWAFFPLYPMIVKVFYMMTNIRVEILGSVISSIITLIASFVIYDYCVDIKNEKCAKIAMILLFVGPYSFYTATLYTESLYILFTILFFYFLKKDKWILAGICGGLVSATRVTGAILVFPMMIMFLRPVFARKEKFLDAIKRFFLDGKYLLSFLLVPSGIFAYMVYLYNKVGDPFAFKNIQIAWGRENSNPIDVLIGGFVTYDGKINSPFWIYLGVWAIFGIVISLYMFKKKKFEEGIFSLITIIIPMLSSLQSIPRYVMGNVLVIIFSSLFIEEHFKKSRWIVLGLLIVYNAVLLWLWFNGNPIMP